MSYDLNVPMLGPVDTTPEAVIALFPPTAERKYDDGTVETFAHSLIAHTSACGLRPSLIAAQIAKETGHFAFGGDVQPAQYNLAGLGATGGGTAGVQYANIEEGVAAVCAHHLTYIYGDIANWPAPLAPYKELDQRYDAVMSTGKGGTVKVLADYKNGWWAYTSSIPEGSLENGYATGILAIANTLLQEAPPVSNEPTQADIGFPVEIDYAPFVGPKRALSDIKWYVQHDTEGGEVGSESVLLGPTASVHALVDRDGSFEYMVPIDTTAWTPGNDDVARQSINVEWVGFRSSGYTEEQYRATANFWKWCVAQGVTNVPAVYIGKVDADGGPEPDVAGMLGHEDVPNPNVPGRWGGVAGHIDPGPLFDWAHFIALCGGTSPSPSGSGTYRPFKETGHGIDGGFKAWWQSHGDALGDVGFPVTEEFQYGGRTTQAFQRQVVQWFPEFKGTPYEFQGILLGSFFAKAQGFTGPGIP